MQILSGLVPLNMYLKDSRGTMRRDMRNLSRVKRGGSFMNECKKASGHLLLVLVSGELHLAQIVVELAVARQPRVRRAVLKGDYGTQLAKRHSKQV
jgi:hypothetical protein